MDNPIKVIFRYKNNHRRIQYQVFIFVGDVPSKVMSIIKSIQDKPLYDMLTDIDLTAYKHMEKFYGKFWYRKFYNVYHIGNTFHLLKTSGLRHDNLEKKFGNEWYKDHVTGYELADLKLIYSYETAVKDERDRKTLKKEKPKPADDEDLMDYHTRRNFTIDKLFKSEMKRTVASPTTSLSSLGMSELTSESEFPYVMMGGDDHEDSNDEEYPDDPLESEGNEEIEVEMDTQDENKPEQKEDEELEFEEGLEQDQILSEEELDMEDMEQLYRDVDIDANTSKTTTMIKDALKSDNIFKRTNAKMVELDSSKDTQMYDEALKNVFQFEIINSQYIFKDDTVKMIKNKICCSIKNNPKYGKNAYLIPSRQYLWSQYFFDGEVQKVMVGQKWMRRNELLQVDIEPNANFRVYEELRGNLRMLRDNIKRYGSKIKREDDDYNILYDYEGYYHNDEIYLADLYNELGMTYSPDTEYAKNISDVYIKLYFPRVKSDDIKYIFDYLNGKPEVENNKIKAVFENIYNDLVLENEVMKDVEQVRKSNAYQYLFKDNYITQSVIHVNLRVKSGKAINLRRIFDTFIADGNYPLIQYQPPDGFPNFKYNTKTISGYNNKKDKMDVVTKWFENSPYGISFKVRITERDVEKFMAINLNDNGRIEYKTQWKEEDMATIEDIRNTYSYVKELIKRINTSKNLIDIEIPMDQEFRYAFINTIQKFELPEKFTINHNDLSEFSRYFFPYVALVIEPRKRQSKVKKDDKKSKYGTYLRYKRVSKYENQARIEQRILYFMRNYDYNDQSLASEISKQFNITDERAMEEIEIVRGKYPNIKKSRKVLKKLENIPKYKPPGIGIDIQGKQRDNYKIRISGARDKAQLDRIITFMNILIYLYTETYLYRRKDRQILKTKLNKLTKIARRRNKVDELVDYNRDIKTVKQMTQLDKKRIGFKPEKGQNQWTRSCQNSGNDKKRRPQQFHNSNIDDMLRKGYKMNKKTGMYERKVVVNKRGKKKTEVTLRAVKLADIDETGRPSGNDIYYTCSPGENGEHMHVGFLTRSNNPYGHCMPCCFKKDPMVSKNKEKRDYFLKCIGEINEKPREGAKVVGDRLYILQDTNKIQEGRFGFLPKYLDFFFNTSLNKTRSIKHHYLVTTPIGYFFKFGSRQDDMPFLNAVGALFDLPIDQIKENMVNALKNDKTDQVFTALNNGDLKTQFETRDEFIKFIETGNYLDFDVTNNLLSIPGVLTKKPVNLVIFKKIVHVVRKSLEKEKLKEDFVVMCQNIEEPERILDEDRETVFMLKENRNYYPVVMVTKTNENTKDIDIKKRFNIDIDDKKNIVNHVSEFYKRNCYEGVMADIRHNKSSLIAKRVYAILRDLPDKQYHPKYQLIDSRNKCKYFVTQNGTVIPVRPSGSIFNLQIIRKIESQLNSFDDTVKHLEALYLKTKKQLPVNPIGVYYDKKNENGVHVVAVMTNTYDIVPVKEEQISIRVIKERDMVIENQPLYDRIDKEISKGRENVMIDERIRGVSHDKYYHESYELFRLHFSEFINHPDNERHKQKFERILTAKKSLKRERRHEIRKVLYRIIDKDLYNTYISEYDNVKVGGGTSKLVHIISKEPDAKNYQIVNNRDVCDAHGTKDRCDTSIHCHWAYNECNLGITRDMSIEFINRLSEEIVDNGMKKMELFREGDYFVSDIVDYNRFAERSGQRIIKSTNTNLKKILSELFGKDNVPVIGKRRGFKSIDINHQQMNLNNPIKDMQEFYIQNLIDNSNTLFRGYVNSIYWIRHPYDDISSRNIGYYNPIQTDLANYFKSLVIDWLLDKKRREEIKRSVLPYIVTSKKSHKVNDFVLRMGTEVVTFTNGLVELYVLSRIHKIPIVIYNDNNKIIYIFDNGMEYHHEKNGKDLPAKMVEKYRDDTEARKEFINLRFSFITGGDIPDEIEVMMYK